MSLRPMLVVKDKRVGMDLAAALEPLTAAAMRGHYDLLLAETERTIERLFPRASSSRVLLRTGGAWHAATSLDYGHDDVKPAWPADIDARTDVQHFNAGVFVPVVPGAMGLWIEGAAEDVDTSDALPLLRQFVAIAVQTCERQRIAAQNLDEVQSLQRVATRILKSHDLGEILLLITQEAKRLLSADICGVLLLEGSGLVMKRCVGNRAPQTAELRMGPGQGLAGRVLADGLPASVENYLASDAISRDFFHLAEAEMVRSALAAPLMGHDAVIGVLEVWRRRPSVFTPLDTMRLVALANLTSIAIENAELLAEQRRVADALGRANAALNERYDTVQKVSALSQELMQQLLRGTGLQALVGTVASFLTAKVALLGLDGSEVAGAGGAQSADGLVPMLAQARARGDTRFDNSLGPDRWHAQPVIVEGEPVAWAVALVGDSGEALTELAIVQLATLAAVQRLEQRAASRARAETIDALVWDLLRADESARAAAIDRAAELKLELDGPLRVAVIELGAPLAGSIERSGTAIRQLVAREVEAAQLHAARVQPARVQPARVQPARSTNVVNAIGLQGTSIALVMADQPTDDVERFAQRLARQLSTGLEGRLVIVGTSSTRPDARGLATAYREAQIALDVARQFARSGAVVYDRAGVVGLLLSLRHEVGMRRFVELNLGKLLAEDEKQRELLLKTLRVFFDVNCSHEAASQRLSVHRKTIAHRLARISELTGLDMSTHDDRLVADLALYVYRLLENPQGQGHV